ncbi:hypothetical protein LEP1GSC035_0496 [Leptospira noguchii str. 2007001578]|uniref:Uncharacterized protein n=2 Tax=Leptospira noguchii TaxID=28182 RepID=M6YF12_9LEPT|nr:hypothetical protein LEP1GSC035_0496 [Leptospira noguchii str. 2007001578]EMO88219.1 hypothetical protein LEP1GSC024_4068 [Leptospira noguchii str. 2001034031]
MLSSILILKSYSTCGQGYGREQHLSLKNSEGIGAKRTQ